MAKNKEIGQKVEQKIVRHALVLGYGDIKRLLDAAGIEYSNNCEIKVIDITGRTLNIIGDGASIVVEWENNNG